MASFSEIRQYVSNYFEASKIQVRKFLKTIVERINVLLRKIKPKFNKSAPDEEQHETAIPTELLSGECYSDTQATNSNAKIFSDRGKWPKQKDVRSWLVALLTFGALIYTARLFHETKRGVDIAFDTLRYQRERDSLNTITQKVMTDSSISLSKKISDTQERFAKIQNRAYMNYIRAHLDTFVIGKRVVATINFMNHGNTPAYECSVKAYIMPIPRPSEEWKPKMPILKRRAGLNTIGQNTIIRMKFVSPGILTKEHLAFIKSGEYEIFISGSVWYKDVWGENHITNVCVRYDYLKTKDFVGYHKYNDAN